MPEEILAIIIVSIVAFTLMSIIKMTLNYRQARHSTGTTDGSLTTSQLEGMIRKAVQDATKPLMAQMEGLEDQLDELLEEAPKQLTAATPRISVEDLEEVETAVPVRSRRRRTR